MHFLFAVDSYDCKPSANGVCTKNIINALVHLGHSVSVICQKRDNDIAQHSDQKIKISKVYYGYESKLEEKKINQKIINFVKKIRFIKNLFFFPVTNRSYVKAIFRKAEEINKTEPVDIFVAVTQLVDHIEAGIFFTNKHKNTKLFIYSLDALSSGYVLELPKYKTYYKRKMRKYEIHALNKCHSFFAMRSHKKYIIEHPEIYKRFNNKILFVDIPLFDLNKKNTPKEQTKKTIVYAGNTTYLDIHFLSKLFTIMDDYSFIFAGFYNDNFKKEVSKFKNVKLLGLISHEEAMKLQSTASHLLAFDTSSTSMIPGKIFEYFLTGKTVIFCTKNTDCHFIEYLNKYQNYILVHSEDKREQILTKIKPSKNCPDNVLEMFVENTPDYTAQLFIKTASL